LTERGPSQPRSGARLTQVARHIRKAVPGFFKRGLRTKIIAWAFVPTAIILFAVALVNFYAYQQVTEELVIERDKDLTRLTAGQLTNELTEYTDLLDTAARTVATYQNNPAARREALQAVANAMAVFDGGVLFLDTFGTVVAAEPERPGFLGQDWSDRPYYAEMLREQITGSPTPIFSDILADGPGGTEVVGTAVPVIGEQGRFLGILVGMFRIDASSVNAFYGDIIKLRIAESGSTYLLDGKGRVLYHSDADHIGEDFSTRAVAQQVQNG